MRTLHLLAISLLVHTTSALYFHINSGQERCFVEELDVNTLVMGTYKSPDQLQFGAQMVQNDNAGGANIHDSRKVGVQITVTDPTRHVLVKRMSDPEGRFAFTSTYQGLHTLCFEMRQPEAVAAEMHKYMRFHLDLTVGEHDVDFSKIAKRDHLTSVELKLMKIKEKLTAIQHDVEYFKRRERAFRDTSESTNRRTMWFSLSQMIGMAVLSFVQIQYLKNYFIRKKIV